MTRSITRRLVGAVTAVSAVIALTMLAFTGPATAAQPMTGEYGYRYVHPGSAGNAIDTIDFDVVKVGNKLKVKNFQWGGYSCGTLTVGKALAVSGKGKFKFLGKAQSAGTARVKIKIKGKFKTNKKAIVTVLSKDPVYNCTKVPKAVVKRKP